MSTTTTEQAEALGYEWAREDETAVESVADWIAAEVAHNRTRDASATGPAADDSYLPTDANERLRALLASDPAQSIDELRRAAVAGYTRRLVEIWREAEEPNLGE